ncbi:MAG: hypothetical protein ACE5FG_00845 [Myxococcota bacterium]
MSSTRDPSGEIRWLYVMWRRPGLSPESFTTALIHFVGPELRALGALDLVLYAADARAEAARAARITRLDPSLDGTLSFRPPCAAASEGIEAVLASCCGRVAGYVVERRVALATPKTDEAPGVPSAGLVMLACLERPDWIDPESWQQRWLEEHVSVALETQSTHLYVRNVVIRALTDAAPPWAGFVEEGFATEAVTSPMLWYDARGSPEQLERNLARMLESCRRFLDLERIESHPLTRYRL